MLLYIVFVLISSVCQSQVFALWNGTNCPLACKCRLEHASETPIHRFMPRDEGIDKPEVPEAIVLETNDVFYDSDELFDESAYVKSATCIVQTEVTVKSLLAELPHEINALTLIQASDSGNKSMKFSDFANLQELKILDIQSAQSLINTNRIKPSYFLLDIDIPLEKLEYLNLERTVLRNSNDRLQALENEVVVFEYVQKNSEGHAITFLEKRTGEVLPYQTYAENLKGEEGPLFTGFASLILLRIYECEIHHIHREMFEGLGSLNYLILEKNSLQFLSNFAFHGTPNLRSLSLAWNNLLNIEITDLAGLLELEYLDLSHNNFTQLSELSLPPFPKLKLCNFANNPITVVFPNTFEVMNTTYALVVGGLEEPLTLQTNSFVGLNLLMSLKLFYLNIPMFQRDILLGMPNLQVLVMTGNIPEIQYDAFLEVTNLDTLILSGCNVTKLSVDSFIGLEKLRVLDLSKNNLNTLPPGIFDVLINTNEIYLHGNHFQTLPPQIFAKVPGRLIRLNENPWHCSCDMSDWKPIIINRIKQKTIKTCDSSMDKGLACQQEANQIYYKYVYDNSVSPKCLTPNKFHNWSVFHVMRRQFRCADFKPKMRKRMNKKRLRDSKNTQETQSTSIELDIIPTLSTEIQDLVDATDASASVDYSSLQRDKLDKLERKLQRAMKMQKHQKMFSQRTLNFDNIDDNNINL